MIDRAFQSLYDGWVPALPGMLFMNPGLAERDSDYDWVRAEDRRHKYHLNLVRRAVQGVDLGDRVVLEIGCGRGGNCYYLSSYANVRHVYGMDSSPATARAARSVCDRVAQFACADIAAIPFRDETFDVVLSIGESPSYPAPPLLLEEVARVLRPGGVFVTMVILSNRDPHGQAKATAQRGPLVVSSDEDITEEVFQALDRPDGVEKLLGDIENDFNRDVVQDILHQTRWMKTVLALALCSARILRLVKAETRPSPRMRG